jgi:hypothetical protein
MNKQLMRVGTGVENKLKSNSRDEFNLLFGARHEFVYLPDYIPWQRVNGTWTGAIRHLINDNCMHWKQWVDV